MKNIFYAIYDEQDRIVTTCENYNEIASFFGRDKTDSFRSAVSRGERVRANHNWYSIYVMDERKMANDKV